MATFGGIEVSRGSGSLVGCVVSVQGVGADVRWSGNKCSEKKSGSQIFPGTSIWKRC